MDVKKIDHVGIAVKDLDSALDLFTDLYGAEVLDRRIFESQKLESAMVKIGESHFELAMSIDPRGVIGKFIDQSGEGMHHVSLQVDDIDKAIERIREKGLKTTEKSTYDDYDIVFVHPEDNFGILVEIIERHS